MRVVVPAENGLLSSINALMNNGTLDLSCSKAMREIIAIVVMSDPINFSEAFLGKKTNAYCHWIMKPDSWGGAIEISILSQYFNVEIAVVDTKSCRIDRFGESIQTVFPTSDVAVLGQAMEIASEAKASRQYTDVANFSIRCLVCQKLFSGQTEAQAHAKATGHINFGEV